MWHKKPPAFYGRGSVFNTVLLGYFFVREKVPSKIGECLGEEDRGCTATDYFCEFGLCQGACARTGKNSIILFGHKVRLSKKRFNRSK
jgi:hypothetical protein